MGRKLNPPESGAGETEEKLPGRTGTLVNYCLLGSGLLLAGGVMAAGFGAVAAGVALVAPIGGKAILGHEKVFNFSSEKELTPEEKALIGTPGHERDGVLRKMVNAISTPIDVVCSLMSGLGKFIPFSGIEFSSAIADGAIITPLKAGADVLEGHKQKAKLTVHDGMAKTAYEAATAPIPVPFLSVVDWTEGVRGKDKAVGVYEKATNLLGKGWRGCKRCLGFNAQEPEQNAAPEKKSATRLARISPQETLHAANQIVEKEKGRRRRIAGPGKELAASNGKAAT